MLLLPRKPGFLVDFVKSPPNRVLAHDLLHPQQRRIDRITSQRRDVRIASVTGQHRQKHRPENVAFAWRVRTRETHRTACNPTVKQAALLQILDEKRQLAEWRHRRGTIPLDVNSPGEGVGHNRHYRPLLHYRLLTRRETRQNLVIRPHTSRYQLLTQEPNQANSRI